MECRWDATPLRCVADYEHFWDRLLEAALWQQATRYSEAQRLLMKAYIWHVSWLCPMGRVQEAKALAHRVLDMTPTDAPPPADVAVALRIHVDLTIYRPFTPRSISRALSVWQDSLPRATESHGSSITAAPSPT